MQILLAASKVIADKLYEFATDRFGSHVASRIIALAGGIDGQGSKGDGLGSERTTGVSHIPPTPGLIWQDVKLSVLC